jgi:two-component system phosphate regulon sensor histidine kinase PhoR
MTNPQLFPASQRTDASAEHAAGRARRVLLTTATALAAILALAATGHADSAGAWAAGIVVTAVGLVAAFRGERESPGRKVDNPPQERKNETDRTSFEDALENLPDPLLIVSAEEPDDLAGKRLAFANTAARALLRIPRDGALLLSAIRRPELLEAVDESLFGGLSTSVSFDTGGVQDRFWRVWTAPLPPRGVQRMCLVLMRDETDARRNERMRADFLANASHELRTPLASLSGFIETLRGHARDDEKARDKFLAIMGTQAERMARLVDDLMSLSRIELNEHIRPDGHCDLGAATADVVDAVALIAQEKGVTLNVKTPARGHSVVIGDRDQILQVIQNLVDNALKYSPRDGTVDVTVSVGLPLNTITAPDPASPRLVSPDGGRLSLLTPDRSDGGLYVMFKVTDHGPGMERQHLPRLAERFYRVEGQKSGERSGTGLGLAIVKHIVNRHRGGLWVESAPGKGARFAAYFPLAVDAVARPPVETTQEPPPAPVALDFPVQPQRAARG